MIIWLLFAVGLHAQKGADCAFQEVQFSPLDCEGGDFSLTLNFTPFESGISGYTVVVNGINQGNFSYNSLPLTLGPFVGDGVTSYTFVLSDSDLPECTFEFTLDPVQCASCEITDLDVIPSECNSEQEFFATIDFTGIQTGVNGFSLTSNGNSLGTFAYGSTPAATVGPFAGDGTTPYTFVVADEDYPECNGTFTLDPIECALPCLIAEVTVEMVCNSNGSFDITVDFTDKSPFSSYTVYIDVNQFDSLSETDFPFTQTIFGATAGQSLMVVVLDDIDCSVVKMNQIPDCPVCSFSNGSAEAIECVEEFFVAQIDFDEENTGSTFTIEDVVGNIYGPFNYGLAPYEIGPLAADGTTNHQFTITDDEFTECSTVIEMGPIACEASCSIDDFLVNYECNSIGALDVSINFDITAPTGSGFNLLINGNVQGFYLYSELPINTSIFVSSGVSYSIEVVDISNEECSASFTFDSPTCAVCGFENINYDVVNCDAEEGTFYVDLQFDAGANGSSFVLQDQGMSIGTYVYSNSGYLIGPFSADGTTAYNFSLIDDEDVTCEETFSLDPVLCDPICVIQDLNFTTSCDGEGEELLIDFSYSGNASDVYYLFVDGVNLGSFNYSDLPETIGQEPGSYLIEIVDSVDADCKEQFNLFVPECVNPCAISDLELQEPACDEEGNYSIALTFTTSDGSETVEIFQDAASLGFFSDNGAPIVLNNLSGDGITSYEILLVDSLDNTCRDSINILPTTCVQPCAFGDLEIEINCNLDGSVSGTLDFDFTGAVADSFELIVEEQLVDVYSYSDLPLGNLDFLASFEMGTITIAVRNRNDNFCFLSEDIENPDCPVCSISNIQLGTLECEGDSFTVSLSFDVENEGTSGFSIFESGVAIATFTYGEPSYSIGPFLGDGVTSYVFSVQDNELDFCELSVELAPVLCEEPCALSNLVITESCTNNGASDLEIDFDFENPSAEFGVIVNGVSYGPYSYSSLPLNLFGLWFAAGENQVVEIHDHLEETCSIIADFEAQNCLLELCAITELLAEASDCDEEGKYLLNLQFNSNQTGSLGFDIYANGTNYGNYNYGQAFYTLGPFDGDGTTIWEFVVVDNENTSCSDTLIFESPFCLPEPDCSFENLELEVVCEMDGSNFLFIDFDYEGTSGLGFDLTIEGISYGSFSYQNLPLNIAGISSAAGSVTAVAINENENLDCNIDGVFEMPDCPQPACSVFDLQAVVGVCQNDGFFFVDLSFNYENEGTGFSVSGNGNNYGTFSYGLTSYQLGPLLGDGTTNWEFAVSDLEDIDCTASLEIGTVMCEVIPDCSVNNMMLSTSCNEDGSFDLAIDFDYLGVSGTGFDLFIDGNLATSHNYSDLPITVLGLNNSTGTLIEVQVIEDDKPNCFAQSLIEAPLCEIPVCSIGNLEYTLSSCNEEGKFFIDLLFDYENVGAFFTVFVNGIEYGPFVYGQPSYLIGPFVGDGSTDWTIQIVDELHAECSGTVLIETMDCIPKCEISNMEAIAMECDEDGFFFVDISFDAENTGTSFNVSGNGNDYGTFTFGQVSYSIGPIYGDAQTSWEFVVSDLNDPSCFQSLSIEPIDCLPPPCVFSNLEVMTSCNLDETVNLTIDFDAENTGSDFFELLIDGQVISLYAYADLPIEVNYTDGNLGVEIQVIDNNDLNCSANLNLELPNCNLPECIIGNFSSTVLPCNDEGFFSIEYAFDVENSMGDEFVIFIDGVAFDTLEYGLSSYLLGSIAGQVSQVINGMLQDLDDPNCVSPFSIEAPACPIPNCELGTITAETNCNEDGIFYIDIDFSVAGSISSSFALEVGDSAYTYQYNELPVAVNYEILSGASIDITVVDTEDITCVSSTSIIAPDCELPICSFENVSVFPSACDDGFFNAVVSFEPLNQGDSGFALSVNGIIYDSFDYGQIFYSIGPLAGDGITSYSFLLVDVEDQSCQIELELSPVMCEIIEPCSISNLTAVAECQGDGSFLINVAMDHNMPIDSTFTLEIGGSISNYLYGSLPLTIIGESNLPGAVVSLNARDQFDLQCFDQTEFAVPDCQPDPECSISNVEVNVLDCDESGLFYVDIMFAYEGVGESGLSINGNGNNYGTFNYGNSPYTLGPLLGDGTTNWEFTVSDNGLDSCEGSVEIGVVFCPLPDTCSITNLMTALECDADGNYDIAIDFDYEEVSSDGFLVNIPGVYSAIHLYEDLPLGLFDLPIASEEISISVVDALNTTCENSDILAVPECVLPSCELADLQYQILPCDEEGNFEISFSFEVMNTSALSFDVSVGVDVIGNFNYGMPSYTIGPFAGDDLTNYELTVVDEMDEACSVSVEIGTVFCALPPECAISELEALAECNADESFSIFINFSHEGTNSDSFDLILDGIFYATYLFTDLPISVANYNSDLQNFVILVEESSDENCSMEILEAIPDCNIPECEIGNLTFVINECDDGQQFTVDFEFVSANTSESFELLVNGEIEGTFNYSNGQFSLGPFEGDGISNYEIVVADLMDGACTMMGNFISPLCEPVCEISAEVNYACNDYFHSFSISAAELGGSDLLNIFINGEFILQFESEQDTLVEFLFSQFEEGELLNLQIVDSENAECIQNFEFIANSCTFCFINDFTINSTECEAGFIDVSFEVDLLAAEPALPFDLYVNAELFNSFTIADLPIFLEGLEAEVQYNFTMSAFGGPVCDVSNTLDAVVCPPDCMISELTVEAICNEAGDAYTLSILFNAEASSEEFSIVIGDQDYGIFSLPSEIIVIDDFPAEPWEVFAVTVSDVADTDCLTTAEFVVPDCGTDCSLGGLNLETVCEGAAISSLIIDFQMVGDGASASLFINSEFIQFFNYSELPLTIMEVDDSVESLTVEIIDSDSENCVLTGEISIPECELPCLLDELLVTSSCTDNGGYELMIDVENGDNLNSQLNILIDGEDFGTVSYALFPVFIWLQDAEEGQEVLVEVVDIMIPACLVAQMISLEFCDPVFTDCILFDLFSTQGPCLDETAELLIQFDVQGEGSGFEAFLDNQSLGTFDYGQNLYSLGYHPSTEAGSYTVQVVDLDTPDCLVEMTVDQNDCSQSMCAYSDLVVSSSCNSDGTLDLLVNFGVIDSPTWGFDLYLNGEQEGFYFYEQLPLILFGIDLSYNELLTVEVVENAAETCSASTELLIDDCYKELCSIATIEATQHACDDEANYELDLVFEHSGLSGSFTIEANFETFGPFDYGESSYTIGPFPGDGNTPIAIMVLDTYADACMASVSLDAVFCEPNEPDCSLQISSTEFSACVNGEYMVVIDLLTENLQSFAVTGNGNEYGEFSPEDLPLTLGTFEGNGESIYELNFSSGDCTSDFIEFAASDCSNDGGASGEDLAPSLQTTDFTLHIDFGEWGEGNSKEGIEANDGRGTQGELVDLQEIDDMAIVHLIDVDSRSLIYFEVPYEEISKDGMTLDLRLLPNTMYIVFFELNGEKHVSKIMHLDF